MWYERLIRAVSQLLPLRHARRVEDYNFSCPFCGRVSPKLDRNRADAVCLWCWSNVWLRSPKVADVVKLVV